MTVEERNELKRLSLDVYGKETYYARLLRKGELKLENAVTSTGNPIQVKRWYPLSVEEVRDRMLKMIDVREAAKAAAEAKKGEKNETKK
jgi:hypothetical protein